MKSAHPFALVCAFVSTFPVVSLGLGVRIPDQDARATARGDAFTATADNPSAIYYNPAGISFLYSPDLNSPAYTPSLGGGKAAAPVPPAESDSGIRLRMGVYSISLANKVTPTSGAPSFNIDHRFQFAPNFYATWQPPKSPLTFGLGIYAPYGFGIWYPETSPIRLISISGNVTYVSINPVIAYKVTDTLSISAGPTFNYGHSALKQGLSLFGAPGATEFSGDGWAAGWNAGIMWRPHPMHSFGLMYRSQTDLNFDGHSHTAVPGLLVDSRETASLGIKFPQNMVLGYSFRPTPKWNLEVNVDWTDWDSLNTEHLQTPTRDTPIPFNWKSSFFYEFGASYTFDGGIVASLGYIYSENSVPNSSFNPVVPDSNRHIMSAGLGKRWDRWSVDLAYQYAIGQKRSVTGTPFGIADANYEFDSHAISLSAGYNF